MCQGMGQGYHAFGGDQPFGLEGNPGEKTHQKIGVEAGRAIHPAGDQAEAGPDAGITLRRRQGKQAAKLAGPLRHGGESRALLAGIFPKAGCGRSIVDFPTKPLLKILHGLQKKGQESGVPHADQREGLAAQQEQSGEVAKAGHVIHQADISGNRKNPGSQASLPAEVAAVVLKSNGDSPRGELGLRPGRGYRPVAAAAESPGIMPVHPG